MDFDLTDAVPMEEMVSGMIRASSEIAMDELNEGYQNQDE